MNYIKWAWVVGGVILASILDLSYMFWQRSNTANQLHRSVWAGSSLGRGKFNVMNAAKHFSNKGKY